MNDLPTLYVTQRSIDADTLIAAYRSPDSAGFHENAGDYVATIAYVPAARLDAANLEIATLKAALKKAIWNAAEHDDGCLYCGEGEIVNGTTTPEHRAVCWFYQAERLVSDAALTPKEPSDE